MNPNSPRRLAAAVRFGLASAGLGFFFSITAAPDPSTSHPYPRRSLAAGSPALAPIPISARDDRHLISGIEKNRLGVFPFFEVPPDQPISHQDPENPVSPVDPVSKSPAAAPSPLDETDQSIQSIERELAALRELKILKERNRLIHLADRTIVTGSRADFAKLESLAQSSTVPALRESADLQILRVDRHFYSRRKLRSYPIDPRDFFPERDSEDALTVGELLQILIDPAAPLAARIRAADLLGRIPPGTQPRLPGYLLHAAEISQDLDLIDQALISFGHLTGVYPNRMFDAAPASVWWDFNNPEKSSTAQSSSTR